MKFSDWLDEQGFLNPIPGRTERVLPQEIDWVRSLHTASVELKNAQMARDDEQIARFSRKYEKFFNARKNELEKELEQEPEVKQEPEQEPEAEQKPKDEQEPEKEEKNQETQAKFESPMSTENEFLDQPKLQRKKYSELKVGIGVLIVATLTTAIFIFGHLASTENQREQEPTKANFPAKKQIAEPKTQPSPVNKNSQKPANIEVLAPEVENRGNFLKKDDRPERKITESASSLTRQGWLAANSEEFARAIELFSDALFVDPKNTDARYGMAYALEKQAYLMQGYGNVPGQKKSLDEAILHYEKLLKSRADSQLKSQAQGKLNMLKSTLEVLKQKTSTETE